MIPIALVISQLHLARSKEFTLHIDNLTVTAGSITCIVGPNGSGKTTLIESIVGIASPQRGTVLLHGQRVTSQLRQLKAQIGYIPDDDSWFIKELTAHEYFGVLMQVYRDAGVTTTMERAVSTLAEQLHFTQFQTPLEQLSHGNKKKVQIIAGLLHRPSVIVVDELRNGLDPLAIIAAEKILTDCAKRGAAILTTTHDLWWAERLAQEVAVLINGRMRLLASTASIVKQYGSLEALFITLTKDIST